MANSRRIGLSIVTIVSVLALFQGVVAAQTPKPIGLVTFVDGNVGDEGADLPLDIYVDGDLKAEGIDFGETSAPIELNSGSYTIEYREAGGTDVVGTGSLTVADASSQSFASFWDPSLSEPFQAEGFPDEVEPISEGNGVLVLRNISDRDPLEVTIDGEAKSDLDAFGGNQISETLPTGTYDVVFHDPSEGIPDIPITVNLAADAYVNVFAAGAADNQSGAIQVIIDSMTELIEFLTEDEPTDVPVPDVAGLSAADATQALVEQGFVVAESTEASSDIEAGVVIRTDPSAGTEVEEGSTVEIVVSTGSDTVEVPDVVGQEAADAETTIQDAGLRISSSQEASSEVDQGRVISTDPGAGTEVDLGSTVAMVISAGSETVIVPDVVGIPERDAKAALEDLGLAAETRTEASEDVEEGLVISTEPPAGVTVELGATVAMLVSTGGEVTPTTEAARIDAVVGSDGILDIRGFNFLPDTLAESLVVGTSIAATERVNAEGLWETALDVSGLDRGATYQLLVTGTDAEGNPFESLQLIPSFGEDSDDIPVWAWVFGLLLLAGLIALLLWLVSRNKDDEPTGGDDATITSASGTAIAADEGGGDTIVMDELPDEDAGGA